VKISVIVTGRAYHAAGQLPDEIELPDESSVDDALEYLKSKPGPAGELPASCLVAVSGKHVGTLSDHATVTLRDGDELTLIAPVAGG
jgi:sulfur carrier protein ThiS